MGNLSRWFVGMGAVAILLGSIPSGAIAAPKKKKKKAGKADAVKISRKPHIDLRGSYRFNPPLGWKGTPPETAWFGEGTAGLSKTRDTQWTAWYDWDEEGDGNSAFVIRNSDFDGSTAEASEEVLLELEKIRKRQLWTAKGVKLEASKPERSSLGGMPALRVVFRQSAKAITVEDAAKRKKAEERQAKNTVMGTYVVAVAGGKLWCCGIMYTTWAATNNTGLEATRDKMFKSFKVISKGDMVGMNKKYGKGEVVCADWKLYRTKNYRIEYNTDDKFAKKLGMHLEAIRQIYARLWPMSGRVKAFRVKCFANKAGYHRFGAPHGSAGYYSKYQKELVTYKTDANSRILNDAGEPMTLQLGEAGDTSFHIMYHEAFHQYASLYVGENRDVYIPSWFNEGMGDYFFGGELKGRRIKIAENWWRVNTIKRAVQKNRHVPLRKLIRYDQSAYYANPSICYAEGWALNYYLLEVAPKKHPRMGKKYRSIPIKMLNELEKNGNGDKATDRAFAGIDMKKLEEDWKAWVLTLEMPQKVKDALAKAQAKEDERFAEDCAQLAKDWTEQQDYDETKPECTAIYALPEKGNKYRTVCRGVHTMDLKILTADEFKALVKTATKATSGKPELVAVQLFYPKTSVDDEEDDYIKALKDTNAVYKWCDKFDIQRLSMKWYDRKGDEEGD